jgi:hypothetical protein
VRTQTNDDIILSILGDGHLLYRSPQIKAGVEPYDFSINIVDVDVLRLEINGSAMLRLVDCILEK